MTTDICSKNATVFVWLLLLAVLTGCPEPPATGRIVSLGFPPPMNADKISLSANDAEVQDALKVVDVLLVSHGFVRDENPDNANVKGFMASYSKLTSEGLRRLDELPNIYFKANHLEIVFFQGRTSDAHKTQLLDALQKELAAKYGADRVRITKTKT